MKKTVTKIICAALASVVALGATAIAGCSQYFGGNKLDGDISGEVTSNGGFAVQKGDFVYFINGVADNTLDNSYGKPVKGSVMRISTKDLADHNYSSVETVVPLLAYAGNYDGGLFIYGDYVYYSTPSTARNSNGEVLYNQLDLKRTKLDATETLRTPYIQFPSSDYDFRFVEEDGVVYLVYVAENETLYDEEKGVKNLHSLNTETGDDTLLAYNISSHIFDAEDKTNPKIYYTMSVTDFNTHTVEDEYNQLYTVTASQTEENKYDISGLYGWDEDEDRYINCGTLVFDGRGKFDEKTPFNVDGYNEFGYTYTLKQYVNGTLFYTRHSTQNSKENLYSVKDKEIGADWNPVTSNPKAEERLLNDGSSANKFKFIFNAEGDLERVINSEDSSLTINTVVDNKLSEELSNEKGYFRLLSKSASVLFIDDNYIYYSVSGGNGLTFNRIDYTGSWRDYEGLSPDGTVTKYTPVNILDIDSVSDWYYPEFICGQLLFASETDSMATYNYVMACDLNGENGVMTNAEISALTDKYNGIIGSDSVVTNYKDTDKYPTEKYANLGNAVKYMFYTGDKTYVEELAVACNAALEEGDDLVYSDETLALLDAFLKPTADNDWKDYTATRKVNGVDVYANSRDYYYAVLGTMAEADKEGLIEDLRNEYLVGWPEDEEGWYDSLSTGVKVVFIIGMCLCGILVLGGVAVGVLLILRARRNKEEELPQYTKKRIKVDTTDDKSVNVYEDEDAPASEKDEKQV